MRFLSSSALASAEKLRLAASCSAAETIASELRLTPHRETARARFELYKHQAACSPASRFGARTATDPPAFSTAAIADFDAPQTENATLALISPEPSNRTPSLARLSTPAFTRACASTVAFASSAPASIAACT